LDVTSVTFEEDCFFFFFFDFFSGLALLSCVPDDDGTAADAKSVICLKLCGFEGLCRFNMGVADMEADDTITGNKDDDDDDIDDEDDKDTTAFDI
jgi:hypothetical protein